MVRFCWGGTYCDPVPGRSPGTYFVQWHWTLNGDEHYTSCMDIQVGAGGLDIGDMEDLLITNRRWCGRGIYRRIERGLMRRRVELASETRWRVGLYTMSRGILLGR